jgi:hypothetical protein
MQVGGVVGGVVEELGDEVVGPDHDRAGDLPGGLPPGDAFGFPHDRQGPVAGGAHEGGRVRADDDAVGDRVVEGLTQAGADALAGGLTCGSGPFDGVAHVGVVAVASLKDGGVAGFDGGEHVADVAGPQLVQG